MTDTNSTGAEAEKILEEITKKSEERRQTDFSAQRTPEFLLDIEKAVAMGKNDRVSSMIKNMFPNEVANLDLNHTFGDILTAMEMCIKEMMCSDTLWGFIRNAELIKCDPEPTPAAGGPVSKVGQSSEDETAILSEITHLTQEAKQSRDELYTRALDTVIDDLRRRILLRVGVIGMQDRLENVAATIEI